jgi:hypothetical protein
MRVRNYSKVKQMTKIAGSSIAKYAVLRVSIQMTMRKLSVARSADDGSTLNVGMHLIARWEEVVEIGKKKISSVQSASHLNLVSLGLDLRASWVRILIPQHLQCKDPIDHFKPAHYSIVHLSPLLLLPLHNVQCRLLECHSIQMCSTTTACPSHRQLQMDTGNSGLNSSSNTMLNNNRN